MRNSTRKSIAEVEAWERDLRASATNAPHDQRFAQNTGEDAHLQ